MFTNNSISISVSDDESDELGRVRARVRKKRKKLGHRNNGNGFTRWLLRKLVKYWMVLIFLPAAGLLLFEASRFVVKPEVSKTPIRSGSELSPIKKPSLVTKSEGNLNRLDPTTRVVAGVRERKWAFVIFLKKFVFDFAIRILSHIKSSGICLVFPIYIWIYLSMGLHY